jgi:hypothetical protein
MLVRRNKEMKRKVLYWTVVAVICLSWLVPSALAATAGKIVLDPLEGQQSPGDTFDVKVVVQSVLYPGGLFGGQFKVSFDNEVLELVDTGVGAGSSMGSDLVEVPVDVAAANASGLSSLYGVSRKDSAPELTGNVELAVLHLKWKEDAQPIQGEFYCLELTDVALGDRDAKSISFNTEPIKFKCTPPSQGALVKGFAYVWAQDHSGSTVTVDTKSGTTDSSGYYEVLAVPMGDYTATADAEGYLSAFCSEAKIHWATTVLREVKMVPGDVDGNEVIDIVDAAAIGLVFGQSTEDKSVDLNRDGVVDIYDLILLARHFGMEGPTDWVCDGIDPASLGTPVP